MPYMRKVCMYVCIHEYILVLMRIFAFRSASMFRWVDRQIDMISLSTPIFLISGKAFISTCIHSWPECMYVSRLAFEEALSKVAETSQGRLRYSVVRPTAFFKSVSGQFELLQQVGTVRHFIIFVPMHMLTHVSKYACMYVCMSCIYVCVYYSLILLLLS